MSGYAFHPADGVLECHSAEGIAGHAGTKPSRLERISRKQRPSAE